MFLMTDQARFFIAVCTFLLFGFTPDALACRSDGDCPAERPVCYTSSGTCTPCFRGSDCRYHPSKPYCTSSVGEVTVGSGGSCEECLTDAHCGDLKREFCNRGYRCSRYTINCDECCQDQLKKVQMPREVNFWGSRQLDYDNCRCFFTVPQEYMPTSEQEEEDTWLFQNSVDFFKFLLSLVPYPRLSEREVVPPVEPHASFLFDASCTDDTYAAGRDYDPNPPLNPSSVENPPEGEDPLSGRPRS